MPSRRLRVAILIAAVAVIAGIIGLSLLGRPTIWLNPVENAGPRPPRQHALGLSLQGQVQAATRHEITAPAAGKVAGLLASSGQPVVAAQELLQLDAPALRQQLVAAQQRVTDLEALAEKAKDPSVQARLDKVEQLARNAAEITAQRRKELEDYKTQHADAVTLLDTLRQARAEVKTTQKALREAEQQLSAAQERSNRSGKADPALAALQARQQQELSDSKAAEARLADALAQALRLRPQLERLDVLRQGVDSADKLDHSMKAQLERLHRQPEFVMLAQGAQRVQEAKNGVTQLEQQVAALSVRAPQAGLLQELRVRPGQPVKAGDTVAVIEETGDARLVFTASATDLSRLAVGWRVKVRPIGGKPFTGTISQLVPGKTTGQVVVQPQQPESVPPPGTALQARL